MNKIRMLVAAMMLALASSLARAQRPVVTYEEVNAPAVLSGPGWDAFVEVTYIGGDANRPKQARGVLLLTDSVLGLYECAPSNCAMDRKRSVIKEGPPLWTILLSNIKEISASTQFKGASTTSKILWGNFAGDKSSELVGLVYETEFSAEAPVFRTRATQAAAIEAKVKFRLKKMGIVLAADK